MNALVYVSGLILYFFLSVGTARAQEIDKISVQINSKTLNLFLPLELISLPCFMPVEIKTSYNSYSSESSIFGTKWTFNYNLRVKVDGRKLIVVEGDGFENIYQKERNLEEATKAIVDQIIIAQKKIDIKSGGLKSASTYNELKDKLTKETAFRDEQEKKLIGPGAPASPGIYYSFSRGPSTLEMKPDNTFKRSFQNGAFELFDKDGKISKSSDRHGNQIDFAYLGKNLVKINDACGRSMNFSYKQDKASEGLVESIKDSLNRSLTFEYYPGRFLKSFKNAKGDLIEFTYDKIGNMKSYSSTTPAKKKQILAFEYNDLYEVIKESGLNGEETRYKRTFVANNRSHSVSEVSRFKEGKLIAREVQEYKSKEFETTTRYDSKGDTVGKETRKISPITGYPSSILDEAGRGDVLDYDSDTGNLKKKQALPSGETQEFEYETKCNQVKSLKVTRPGQPVAMTTFQFDGSCNLLNAEEKQLNKVTVSISVAWNKQGKIAFLRDKINQQEIAFTYWKYGKPESITLKDVGTLLVKYKIFGDIEKVETFPHGKGKERFAKIDKSGANALILSEVKMALDDMLGFLRPSGLNIGL